MDATVSQYEARVRAFIDENFPPAVEGEPVPAGLSLLESGVIDSMGVLLLVTWLEQEFGFIVDDDEVVPENLDSIAAIDGFIARKVELEPAG
ncbi:acyl carrier protein [Luteimonas padinae]|uniref:acyl carrier protein n=1 Tax=Luteimonas padinae TaxID=1714359 RepID=UPI001672B11B|nr:acyl carrier protein [Luteimonas padinae]GHD65343.1 acyl carrier protein [Luteimonas padinae]